MLGAGLHAGGPLGQAGATLTPQPGRHPRRAGTAGSESVNDPRGQAASRHRHRRLCHTSRTGASPYWVSRGWLTAWPFTEEENTPHDGHAPVSSAVTRCTTRAPSSSSSTRPTASP